MEKPVFNQQILLRIDEQQNKILDELASKYNLSKTNLIRFLISVGAMKVQENCL